MVVVFIYVVFGVYVLLIRYGTLVVEDVVVFCFAVVVDYYLV